MLVRISREDHWFDLGLEIGNVDEYCKNIIHFIIEAIANERRSLSYEYPGTAAWDYLFNYGYLVSNFAFLLGHRTLDARLKDDVGMLYAMIASTMDEEYPDWAHECPSEFKFRVTPGFFEFSVDPWLNVP